MVVPDTTASKLVRCGSGTFVTADGLGITNYHVVAPILDNELATGVLGMAPAWDKEPTWAYTFEVVAHDEAADLALFRIKDAVTVAPGPWRGTVARGTTVTRRRMRAKPAVPFVELHTGALAPCQPVTCVGFPGLGGRTQTLSRTEVGGVTPMAPSGSLPSGAHFIKFTGSLNCGSSGGALLSEDGRLVGIPSHTPTLPTSHTIHMHDAVSGKWRPQRVDFDPAAQPLNHAVSATVAAALFAEVLNVK